MINKEFFAALEQLEKEKGIDKTVLLDAIEAAANELMDQGDDLFLSGAQSVESHEE